MRFYFDIDDEEFEDECGIDFKQTIMSEAVRNVALWIYQDGADLNRWNSEVKNKIDELFKTNKNEICEQVIERVAEKIAKRKSILELTPKASELAAADKENIAYFEQMIDKAIAKRFGG